MFAEYLSAGLSVIPIRADGSKAPAVSTWREFMNRRATADEGAEWERRFEGVAMIGGAVSGNLEILDLDEPTIVRPFIDALKAADPTLPSRLCFIRTPRRNESGQAGCHLVYRCEVAVGGNCKLAMSELEPEIGADGKPTLHPATGEPVRKPRTLIETRGEGGYAITVGSSGRCHPSGREYEHVYGPTLTELSAITAAERQTLHCVARTFDRSIGDAHVDPPVSGYERAKDGDSPGDAFNRQSTWADILTPHGWTMAGESGGIKRWRRPGKATGISATTGILSQAGNELLTVFSTNAYPFEGVNGSGRPGVTYSKFGAFALLNHKGDFEAAAKALMQLGYGTPSAKPERKSRVLKMTACDAERRYLEMLRRGQVRLTSLGLGSLDHAIGGGVEPGEMVVIGGLTSHGKSVCGLQALRATVEGRGHAIMFSHEMGGQAVAKRLLQSRVKFADDRWADCVDSIMRDHLDYWSECGQLFLLEDCRNIDAIEREAEEIAREFKLTMIVIDHAQLTEGKGTSRYEQLTNASARFKQLAVRHECAVVVLSQLNREAAKGEAGAHHLRETGALEQDADVVILVRWPWKDSPQSETPSRYLFRVVKNRNRPIVEWQVEARFRPSEQTIYDNPSAERPATYGEFDQFGG